MASAAKRAPVKSPREEAEEPASAQPAPAGRARRRLLLIGGGLLAVAALASGVTWMLLRSSAVTTHACPYDNGTVKLCRLEQ